jgi:hypothetical protein
VKSKIKSIKKIKNKMKNNENNGDQIENIYIYIKINTFIL